MPAWKRVLTSSDVTNFNLGNTDLTITAGIGRSVTLGNASSSLTVFDSGETIGGIFHLNDLFQRIGGGTNAQLSLSGNTITADKTSFFIIESDSTTDDTPVLKLYKNHPSPSDGDDIGRIHFHGEDAVGHDTQYGAIEVDINDVTNTTEDSVMRLKVRTDGTVKTFLTASNPNISATLSSDQFLISTQSDPVPGTGKPNLILSNNNGDTIADGELCASVLLRGRNDANQTVNYVDFDAVMEAVADGDEVGRLDVSIKNADGSSAEKVLSVKGAGGSTANIADANDKTINEKKLDSLEVRETSLEQLTRRSMYQFDFTDTFVSGPDTVDGVVTDIFPDLGHTSIKAILGTFAASTNDDGDVITNPNYDESFGFLVPFDSYLTGCTVAYQTNSNVTSEGHLAVHAIIVKPNPQESVGVHLMTSAANNVNNANPIRHSVFTQPEGSQRSIKVEAGDKIIPRLTVTKGADGDGGQFNFHTYNLVDVLGHFYLYAESSGL